MEVNRLTADKDENEWKEVKKRERAKSDPSPYKPEGAPKAALRPPKPPQEFTAAAKRIENGPCKWHKKGICDWGDYCNMDHRPEAMAKLPAVPPRQPPRSVRNATAVSEKDELIALLLQQTQRMEQLEGKLILRQG